MTHLSAQFSAEPHAIVQCVTLIPCHTLEDFPSFLEDAEAKSLLAAWTAAWHPSLIATTGRLPRWNRADSLPETLAGQLIFVPASAEPKLPSGFQAAIQAEISCRVVRADDRSGFLRECERVVPGILAPETNVTASAGTRTITPDDFFALGYAWLQVQLMTRRLRYTSNLDEIFFSSRVVEAAQKLIAGDGVEAAAALHEAFDALAQERDHYFSNDPHLIDLTLLASTTLGSSLALTLSKTLQAEQPPINVLIDCTLARTVAESQEPAAKQLLQLIDTEVVGVAGGGLKSNLAIHHQTAASARQAVADAKSATDRYLGKRCEVFARVAGPTPGDLAMSIAKENYIGAIPIDFASGEGWASEAKLIWSSSVPSIDVLVSKPIDGSRSDSFLSLAVRLGQAIDSGEIAAALIVHWPDGESDAYRDLRRAASWGLALGRFWKIDDFFRTGQHPYHHHRGQAAAGADHWLSSQVAEKAGDPLALAAKSYIDLITTEAACSIEALATLINPISLPRPSQSNDLEDFSEKRSSSAELLLHAANTFCDRLTGGHLSTEKVSHSVHSPLVAKPVNSYVVINPHAAATRVALRMDAAPVLTESVFGATKGVDGRFDVTVDVPAHGFVALRAAPTPPRRRWLSSPNRIAKGAMLINEFMQVEISPTCGGIKGVYSSGRSNRYSMRMVHVDDDAGSDTLVSDMMARALRVVRSDEALGVIETEGVLTWGDSRPAAEFTMRYSLARGSRWLWVEADLDSFNTSLLGVNPWRSYVAIRSAIATEAAILLAPLRDKLHRVEGKRLDSPAGLLIDETSRQTLLFNDGRPAHRRRGDRYLDSILLVRGEQPRPLRFAVGFDCPSPLTALRAIAVPPTVVELASPVADASAAPPSIPASGWLMHCATTDVQICDLRTESTSPLILTFLAVATRCESRKAKVRFCRSLVIAHREANGANRASSSVDASDPSDGFEVIEHSGDSIEFSLVGHEVTRIRVELASH